MKWSDKAKIMRFILFIFNCSVPTGQAKPKIFIFLPKNLWEIYLKGKHQSPPNSRYVWKSWFLPQIFHIICHYTTITSIIICHFTKTTTTICHYKCWRHCQDSRVVQGNSKICVLYTEISTQSSTKIIIFSLSFPKTKKLWKVWKLESENPRR